MARDGRQGGRRRRSGIVVAIALVAVAACTPTAAPTPKAASPAQIATIGSSLEPSASVAGPVESDIAYAVSQRKAFGLRADEAWVRAVAADPRATIDTLDFPMLPEESAEFQARQASFEEVAGAAQSYGEAHADEFGGVWIDQERHVVVTAWTANAALHRVGILAQLGKAAPIETKLVRYSEANLRALQDRMTNDRDWLGTIPALMTSSSVDVMANIAELSISSANPAAAALILAHYAVPPDKLRVVSDGTGILLQPRGTIHGRVVVAGGGGIPAGNDWMINWVADHPTGGDCGDMTGLGVDRNGGFDLPCAPGGWTVAVQALKGDSWVDIGAEHVVVAPGRDIDLTIPVDPAKAH